MGFNFTVDPTHELLLLWGIRVNCAVSFCIDVLAIHLLWTKAPAKTGAYKYLLFVMQTCSALINLHMGGIFVSIPLFPLIALYCDGFVCKSNPHACVVSFYFLVLSCLITLNVCVFYRHQAVLPYDHWLKLGKKQRIFLYSQYAIITQLMTVFTYFAEHESTGRSEYLEK
ncbi:hypothetical protein PRIPAC_79049, partial [Pristionchus pacificus]|uniref:G protein-coupled receptor n=1 Tax=Pristionchus pacificus TaxID=54126 RepID=A0A2A6BVT7_PRIPA